MPTTHPVPLRHQPTIDSVRELLEADIDITAGMLAAAMRTDPAYRYFLPERYAGLVEFFIRNLRTHLPYRCTHVALDARGALLATVTMRPPGGVDRSLLSMLRHGLVPFASEYGLGATKRMLWLKSRYDTLEAAAAAGAPHHYVHMMAVWPALQGQGIGGQLLSHVLEQVGRDAAELPAVLTTHLYQNVTFYRRAGFEVSVLQELNPPGGDPYPVWSMRRQGRPASRHVA